MKANEKDKNEQKSDVDVASTQAPDQNQQLPKHQLDDNETVPVPDEQMEEAKATTPEEAGKTKEEAESTEPADTAIDVVSAPQADTQYEVTEGDLQLYPELKEQDVKIGDCVDFGTKYVLKSVRANEPRTNRVPWPTSISARGI